MIIVNKEIVNMNINTPHLQTDVHICEHTFNSCYAKDPEVVSDNAALIHCYPKEFSYHVSKCSITRCHCSLNLCGGMLFLLGF